MAKTLKSVTLTTPMGRTVEVTAHRTGSGWKLSYAYLYEGIAGPVQILSRRYASRQEALANASRAFMA